MPIAPPRSAPASRHWPAPLTWLLVWAVMAIVARVLLSQAVMWDQAEQLIWTQSLQWGYGAQPPLYTWVQSGVNALLGPSVLSLAVNRRALIVLTFVFMALAARQIVPRPTAWLAALGMAWLLLGQSVSMVQMLGALLVVGTVMVLGLRRR